MTVSNLTAVAFVAVALSLAAWSYRRFGLTIFIWLILVRVCSTITSAVVMIPDPANAQKALERVQKKLESDVFDALQTIWMVPIALSLLSGILLLLLTAAELGHFGPKIVADYEAHLCLRLAYRCRFVIGIAAILCAIGPTLFTSYVMRTGL